MLDAIAKQTGCTIAAEHSYAGGVGELCRGVEVFSRAAGMPITVNESVLTERAAFLGLKRNGAVSASGTCRMIKANDGWIAVNLPRPSDIELLPAWIGVQPTGDVWPRIVEAARTAPCAKLVAEAQTLGLAVAQVSDSFTPSFTISRLGKPAAERKKRPLVLDLSSLWAGPLCGALLAEAGTDVIKLESRSRPDGARFGSSCFFARLNAGKRSLVLDLPQELETLRKLFAVADVVIESARPRVMANWGFSLPEIFATNPHLTWISITAYGRSGARANWVGFGDDVAAAAGLCADGSNPKFIGDAVADPLTGLAAAASAFACLAAGGGFLVDANLFAAAHFVASAPRFQESAWTPIAPPVTGAARALGADNDAILRELLPA